KQHVIGCEDQDEHEKHEQIQIGEEAVVAAFVGHVAGGINVDEPAYAGDNEKHDHGELVDLQIEAGAEISGDDPGEVLLHPGNILRRQVRKFGDGFERGEERQAR